MKVQALSFPTYEFNIINKNDKRYIFDILRKKYVALLPEEWVRQHLILYLVNEKQFPKGLMKIEHYIKMNKQTRFTDITVFDRMGKPLLLAECKSYKVPLSQYTFEQIGAYGSALKAPYFLLTNGLKHFVYQLNWQTDSINFLTDVPVYGLMSQP